MSHSTIAAIATGTGGGVGMIRLSGPEAFAIAGTVFSARNTAKLPGTMPGYTGALGTVRDAGGVLDEAVLFVYRAPHSYTGEDVVELTCHGGAFVLGKVLAALVQAGARPAAAGEFTRRALQNGKMSLTEAESVVDIIAAQNTQSLRAAMGAMDGALHRAVAAAAGVLTDICAHIAAWIDYPEEDVQEVATPELRGQLASVADTLCRLGQSYEQGRLIREGIVTAIVGSANVGKSTLMNCLAGRERSIVTDIPGTTRDVVEEAVRLGEWTLLLQDTAGLRETDDPVERIGVQRSREALQRCDLVLAVFDKSSRLSPQEYELLQQISARTVVAVFNKSDLPAAMTAQDIEAIQKAAAVTVTVSARTGEGLPELARAVGEALGLSHFDPNAALVANARQLECIVGARQSLAEGLAALDAGETLDAVSVCLEEAADALLALTGAKASAETIDKVFEQFCVGK